MISMSNSRWENNIIGNSRNLPNKLKQSTATMSGLDENSFNRRLSRSDRVSKPRDSNPFGALVDSDASMDMSRRSSRASLGSSGKDLMSLAKEQTVFVHADLLQFDEIDDVPQTSNEVGGGAEGRRKTIDGAAIGKQPLQQPNTRRNTFAPSSTLDFLDASTAALVDVSGVSSNSTMKRSWSNQSPSASVASFERSSDRKRAGGKSPNGRRMTVDPDDLAALMNEIENDDSRSKGSISIQDITSSIVIGSITQVEAEVEAESASQSSNTFETDLTDCGDDGRRTTADPADLAALAAELNDTAPSTSASGTGDDDLSSLSFASSSSKGKRRSSASTSKSAASTPTSAKSGAPARPSKSGSASGKKSCAKSHKSDDEEEDDEYANSWNGDCDDTTSSSIGQLVAGGGGRRLTADAADIAALMNDLGDDEDDDGATATITLSVTAAAAAAAAALNDSVVSTRSTRSTRSNQSNQSGYSTRSRSNAATSASASAPVVPAKKSSRSKLAAVSSPIRTKKAGNKDQDIRDDRRMTADPADMQALLDGLNNSIDDSRASFGGMGGRESIDTVVLTRQVANMLDDLDNINAASIGVEPAANADISTLSYSVTSSGSRRRSGASSVANSSSSSSKKSPSSGRAGRRSTADGADLVALVAELEGEGEGKDVTEPTAAVIESVRQVLGCSEPGASMECSIDRSNASMSMSLEHADGHDAEPEAEAEADVDADGLTTDSLCSLSALLRRDANATTDSPSVNLRAFAAAPERGSGSKRQNQEQAPISPSSSTLPSTKGTGLKSCLSSRKTRPPPASSTRRTVVFGSPKAAEFTRGAPTNAMTPLDRAHAKSLFSMVGSAGPPAEERREQTQEEEDEATAENSRILEEWDRLTSNGDGSDDDEIALPATPVFDQDAAAPASSSSRRKSMLQPLSSDADVSHTSDNTCTVELPGNLSELLRDNVLAAAATAASAPRAPGTGTGNGKVGRGSFGAGGEGESSMLSMSASQDHTQELEMDLESVMRRVDYAAHSIVILSASDANSSASTTCSGASLGTSSSGAGLGPLLGLSRPQQPVTGAVSGTPSSSASTPMSAIGSTESEVSFRVVPEAVKRSVQFSLNSDSSRSGLGESRDDSVLSSSMMMNDASVDGATVQLEGALGELLVSGGSGKGSGAKRSDSTAAAPKRRNTPYKPRAAAMFGGDASMQDDEEEEEEHTTHLEANLQALVAQMETSDDGSTSLIMAPDGEGEGEGDNEADISTASTRSLGSVASCNRSHRQSDSHIIGDSDGHNVDLEAEAAAGSRVGRGDMSAMMSRLRTLNAGARQNSLSQCGTPSASAAAATGAGAAGSRLSLGIKRQSLLNSASRARDAVRAVRMASFGGGEQPASGIAATLMSSAPAPAPAVITSAPVSDEGHSANLMDVLTAANLTNATNVSESSFSLHAALQSTKALSQNNPALYPLVACAIIDLLKAAIEEANNVPADIEALSAEWAAVPAAVASSVATAVAEQRSGKSTFLPSLAQSCRVLCSKRWGVWEGHLLDIGTEALQTRIAALQGNIQAINAQKDRMLEQEREMYDASRVATLKAESEAMQTRIRVARAALEASKERLAAIGESTSLLLEGHRERLVGMTSASDRRIAFNAEAQVIARMQQHDNDLLTAHRGVDRVRKLIDVVNRLTYCRTRAYTTAGIEIEVMLCSALKVTLFFHLALDEQGQQLVVTSTDARIEKTEVPGGDRTRDMAEAFMMQVLCSDEIDGPVSPRALAEVSEPKDIPAAIRKVRCIRQMLFTLNNSN